MLESRNYRKIVKSLELYLRIVHCNLISFCYKASITAISRILHRVVDIILIPISTKNPGIWYGYFQ